MVFSKDYQDCMNGRNKSFVSIIPPQGNLATERVGLVIKYHLVKNGGKREKEILPLSTGREGKMKDRMRNT